MFKRYLLSVFIIFLTVTSFAQFPNNQGSSNTKTLFKYLGGLKADSGFIQTSYVDTASANANFALKFYNGATIYVTSDSSLYVRYNGMWVKQRGAGGNTGIVVRGVDSVTFYPPNLICEWVGGFSTCFRLNRFHDSVSINYNGQRYNFWNNGTEVDSVLAITGVAADSIYFISPLHVTGNTVSQDQVSPTDSGWVAPGQKLDSATIRNDSLIGWADGTIKFGGYVSTLGKVVDTLYVTSDSLYMVVSYTDATLDSIQWVSSSGGGGGGGGSGLTRQVITSGTTATVTGGNYVVTFDPSSTIATFTLTMPSSPSDMQTVEISFGGTLTAGVVVTALTISANSGQTIQDNTPPGSGAADNTIYYRYYAAKTVWQRIKL